MKVPGELEVELHSVLILAFGGGKWTASYPGHLMPGTGSGGSH